MTVAFDALGQATTNTGGGISSQSWTHTPVGTPKAIVVGVQIEEGGTGSANVTTVTGVTYGGVAMTPHGSSPNDGGETPTQRQYFFTLFSGIPTGAQTVVTSFNNSNGMGRNSRSMSFTGLSLGVIASAIANSSGTNPKISVATGGVDCCVVGMLCSGQDTAAAVSVDGSTTGFGGVLDVGAVQQAFARKTANTTGTDGPGWTVASSAYLLYALAIGEVSSNQALSPAKPSIAIVPGTLGALGHKVSPTKPSVAIVPGTPAISLAGELDPVEILVAAGTPEVTLGAAPIVPVSPFGPTITIEPQSMFVTPFTPLSMGSALIAVEPRLALVQNDTGQRDIAPDNPVITIAPKSLNVPPPRSAVGAIPRGLLTIEPSNLRVSHPGAGHSGSRGRHGRGDRGDRGRRGRNRWM